MCLVKIHRKKNTCISCCTNCLYLIIMLHVPESLFKQSCSSQPPNVLKNRLRSKCFIVGFVKVLRTSFLKSTSERLFLYFCRASSSKAASDAIAKSPNKLENRKNNIWLNLFFTKIRSYASYFTITYLH